MRKEDHHQFEKSLDADSALLVIEKINTFEMKLSILLVFVIAVLLAFSGQTEGKSFWKRIEKVGQNVRKAAEKTLPTVVGYAGVAKQFGVGK
ncbi:cecropin-A [Leptinotarsa decemlineata]|uniref:cecropin-A n=1 Tax=Leptinotarsa decemlineata TaxID=7539 RepID=UPI003D309713